MDENKRKQFIGRISHALGHSKTPDHVVPFAHEHGPQFKMYQGITEAEIIDMFKAGCAAFDTKLIETTKDKLAETVVAEINANHGGKVAYSNQKEVNDFNLTEVFKANNIDAVQWQPSLGRETNINNVKDANIGITFADLGVAETGTIIQISGVECGRALSLLPDIHIGIVKQSAIVPRLTQSMKILQNLFDEDPGNFPTNICHISGPSRTADIELINVMGAHGPVAVTFILIKDM